MDIPSGVYLGKAVVWNNNGNCYVLANNLTKKDVNIEFFPQNIIPFNLCEFQGDLSTDPDSDNTSKGLYTSTENYLERVARVSLNVQVPHLTPEERRQIFDWVRDYADIFHLKGQTTSVTQLVQHCIVFQQWTIKL